MEKSKGKTSMLKKIIIGIIAVFGILFILSKLFPINYFEEGKQYYGEKKYEKAVEYLNKVEKNDENYLSAVDLIKEIQPIVDSINIAKEELKEKEEQSLEEEKNKEKIVSKPNKEEDKLKDKELENENSQKEQLERELKSINKGIKFADGNTVEELQMDIVLLGSWAKLIKESENSEDEDTKKLSNQLKSKVSKLQVSVFPKLREKYTEIVARKMWENDIDVYSNGTGKKYINFSGGVFARNRNKQDFQNQVNEVLTIFRFKQSRYRWYKNEDEYTYYTMFEGKDSDLVIF